MPGRERVAAQRHRLAGQRLADPGAAAGLAEHGTAVHGVLGPGRPVQVGEQVRRRPWAAAASRTGPRAARPCGGPSPAAGSARRSRAATSTSAKSRVASPAHADRVRSADLAFSSTLPGGLVVAQPQAGRACPGTSRSARARRTRTASARPDRPRARASPSWAAKSASTPMPVRSGASDQPAPAPAAPDSCGPGSGAASSAGALDAASFSAARTTSSIWSSVTPARETTPAAAPSPCRSMAITVSRRDRATPLVVSVLPGPAQVRVRGLVGDHDAVVGLRQRQRPLHHILRPPAVHPSQLAHQEASSAVLSIRMPRISTDGAAVADRGDLAGLTLPAVERAAEHVGLRAAHGLHGVPEVGGGRLVGDVAQLARQPAVR